MSVAASFLIHYDQSNLKKEGKIIYDEDLLKIIHDEGLLISNI